MSELDPLYRYESQKDIVYPDVKPWPPILEQFRDKIFEITGQRCNHCVINQYRGNSRFGYMYLNKCIVSLTDNNDHIGYHFDKTGDFVNNSNVITLSFGGERILRLKHNKQKLTEDIHLKAGSLFVLGWKTNSLWKHSIIKTKRHCDRRVSLTYRLIKTIKHRDGTVTENNDSNFLTKRSAKEDSYVTEREIKRIKVNDNQ